MSHAGIHPLQRHAPHPVGLGFSRLQGRHEPAPLFLKALEQVHPSAQQLVHVAIAAGGDHLGRKALQLRGQGDSVHVDIIGTPDAFGKDRAHG